MISCKVTDSVSGVCPVLAVPFDDRDNVDVSGFVAGVIDVQRAGACGVMWPGFASEFHKLSCGEVDMLQRELLATTKDLRIGAVIAVQDHATHLACDRAVRALEAGAAGINLLPPFLFRPERRRVRAAVSEICRAVGASGEIVLQYAPDFTGPSLTVDDLLSLRAEHPNLRAVKVEVSSPGPLVRRLSQEGLAVTVGMAGMHMFEALDAGAVGVQPGAGFVALYRRIVDLLQSGERHAATGLFQVLLPALTRWMDSVEHILAADKAVLERRGVFGSRRVRAPGWLLDPEDEWWVEQVVAQLADLTT